MKLTMYGAPICIDCVEAKKQLKANTDIELDYRDITKSTTILKEFLAYRDYESIFQPIKEAGKIGIPFFILEDGSKTFDYTKFIVDNTENEERTPNACSIDGKGNC